MDVEQIAEYQQRRNKHFKKEWTGEDNEESAEAAGRRTGQGDGRSTWPVEKVICARRSIYSSIAFSVIDGKIYVYWEKNLSGNDADGFDLVVSTMTLDWITDGKDTWTPPKKQRLKYINNIYII